MKRLALYAVILLAPLLGGQSPLTNNIPTPQQELAELTRRGYTYRYLHNNLIELTEPATGTKPVKSLATTDEATIRAWAQQRGVPMLEIDPAQIDTNLYTGWHQYWTEVPLGNLWEPLQFGDLNKNGLVDVYGVYKNFQGQNESRIYEINTFGQSSLAFVLPEYRSLVLDLTDVDRDSLFEVMYLFGHDTYFYEQCSVDSLPTTYSFHYTRDDTGSPGYTRMAISDLDIDGINDFLYKGTEYDSSVGYTISKVIVAEFDSSENNFKRVWRTSFYPGSYIGGFSIGDFDGDGFMEFVCSDLLPGVVYLVENIGDNIYEETWQDSTPFVNLYYHGSVDVNGDGLDEFFVCATMGNGNWITVFEADGNNTYSPRAIFHILDGGTFDEPVLLSSDIDGDGKPEMSIPSGSGLYVFKWNGSEYYLWYYKYVYGRQSAQVYKFASDLSQSIIIGRAAIDSLGRVRYYSEIYRPGPVLSAIDTREVNQQQFWIKQNYPNPFNPSTNFRYSVASTGRVTLKIYDIRGTEITTVIDNVQPAGVYVVNWEPQGVASGIYLYSFRAGAFSRSGKMILLR